MTTKRQRCMKCKTLVTMTVDRIVKGKRYVVCMSCYNKEDKETEQLTFKELFSQDEHLKRAYEAGQAQRRKTLDQQKKDPK